ncbi:hypothetical protein E0L36_02315 [Streptomyces sp. AJS327]|uniref:hypothetical protein n=1 Tax=Streptomyces sp. AJS327 TaxID=2545265 RepID=UPI0015DD5476|nr:hypothetical protein [Streptomyces sp. AJS327]MBA0049778.1 hypothetical protein [Streptomyces sp. AJS327]
MNIQTSDRYRYMVAPLYLAGPESSMTVLGPDWHHQGYADRTSVFVYRCDSRLVVARQRIYACDDVPESPDLVWHWEFTGHPALEASPVWKVKFSHRTPPEFPAAVADSVNRWTATPRQHVPPQATEPLAEGEWMADHGTNDVTWYSPEDRGLVIARKPEVPGEEGLRAQRRAPWVFAARLPGAERLLWAGVASAAAPSHILYALCAGMADQRPVPRHEIPQHGPVLALRVS